MSGRLPPLRKIGLKLKKSSKTPITTSYANDSISTTIDSPGVKQKENRKRSEHQAKKRSKSENSDNNEYLQDINELKESIPNWDNMYVDSKDNKNESRVDQLIRVEVIGQSLCDKYAWAIPDLRALRILANFSPLIEIGSGKGYWAYLLSTQYNCDIICYDKYKIKKPWIPIHIGGPEVLKLHERCTTTTPSSSSSSSSSSIQQSIQQQQLLLQTRNLFLCYPDENESMAIDCLHNYTGDYILHVGELMVSGGTKSQIQSPWGRTSTSEFQVTLMELFHCVLMAEIPRFPFSSDHITVWKRTKMVMGKETALAMMNDDDDDDDKNSSSVSQGKEEEEEEDNDTSYSNSTGKKKMIDTKSIRIANTASRISNSVNKQNDNNNNNNNDTNDDNDIDNDDDDDDEREDNDEWKSIPVDELIRWNIAAPAYAYLLSS